MSVCDPGRECPICPRLVAFREHWREREPGWFNAPVPTFGPRNAGLLIVGLAPGLRGANRTGRPFTGDGAGDLLYPTLLETGFATGTFGARPDDGLQLHDCRITNAVRCVPPENKPVGAEIRSCNGFLSAEISAMVQLRYILALGGIAHNAVLDALGVKRARAKFGHAAVHDLDDGLRLIDSYHCSRLNTNTGRLTPDMFRAVFASIREGLRAS